MAGWHTTLRAPAPAQGGIWAAWGNEGLQVNISVKKVVMALDRIPHYIER